MLKQCYLHLFFILIFIIRWVFAERHLDSFFRAVEHDPVSKFHRLLDHRLAAEEHPAGFGITAVRA